MNSGCSISGLPGLRPVTTGPGIDEDLEYKHVDGYLDHHRVPETSRTLAQHEWIRLLDADHSARYSRAQFVTTSSKLRKPGPNTTRRFFGVLLQLSECYNSLLTVLSPIDISNLMEAFAVERNLPQKTLEEAVPPHLLQELFPGAQYRQVQELMAQGTGFTLLGDGVREFLNASLDWLDWKKRNPGKKIHLLLIVTPSQRAQWPDCSFRQDKPDVQERLAPQYSHVRATHYGYWPINAEKRWSTTSSGQRTSRQDSSTG